MSEIITAEAFNAAIPGYATRALQAARILLGEGMLDASSGIQVNATVIDIDPPGYQAKEHVTDRERMAELWKADKEMTTFRADAPIDGARLAVQYDRTFGRGRHVRVWAYGVPERDWSALLGRDKPDVSDEAPIDWIGSDARKRLANLRRPGYVFVGGATHRKLGQSPSGDTIISRRTRLEPHILAYVYTQNDRLTGQWRYRGSHDVRGAPAHYFADAIAPICTESDRRRLELGVATYHTHTIETLLRLLGGAASK